MSCTIAIHQPEYFPWLGFVDKAIRADVFVLLDTVQFDRSSLQHRAKVMASNGPAWMTMPFVHRFPQRIDEVLFADSRWPSKHLKTLQASYGRAPGFASATERLSAYYATEWRRLVDATVESARMLLDAFGVQAKVVRASEIGVSGEKADLVLGLCRELGATRYLSGRTGASYLDAGAFETAGVEIAVQTFSPPQYHRPRPLTADEQRGLSALDAWLNLGNEAPNLLRTKEVDPR